MSATPSGTLGRFIREQRQLAHMSVRELARLASISNAYLSQVERGLHEPSVRVLESLAAVLEVPVEQIVSRGSRPWAVANAPTGETVESVIRADARLALAQKEALLAVYRSFVAETAEVLTAKRQPRRTSRSKSSRDTRTA